MIPESFKQDLLNRVDIVELVSRYVQLRKGGANYLGLCPFHGEKTPSFTVSPAKQFYHCFGCGAHGNAIGFQMAYANVGYIDALKDLAASVGMQVPESRPRSPEEVERQERATDLYALMEKALEFYRAELKSSPKAIEYLKGRGLTGEIAARFRIGYAPDDWQGLKKAFDDYADAALVECGLVIDNDGKRYDRFRDRVMFPIYNARGAVIGFGGRVLGQGEPKYLNSPETPLFEKGREVYGLVQARDAIRTAGRVLVVEGYMDVVALAQFGVGYAVATLGTATTPVHVSKLLRLTDELVFCFDGDAAGRKAAWRALEVSLPLALDHKPVRFLFLPQGDDPDTFIRAHGKEVFEQRVRESPTLSGFLLSELRGQAEFVTAEGRSRFLAAAKPYLHKIAAPALRLQVLKEIAALAQVSQEEAERLLELRVTPTYRRAAPPRASAPARSSTEAQLVMWVLASPERVLQVDLALLDPAAAETRFLAEIARIAEEGESGELTQPILIEMFRGSQHEPVLNSAQKALLDLDLAQETAESEIAMCLLTLRIHRTNDEVERLKQNVGQDPRDRAKQVMLQAKLQELDQMKRMRREGRATQ
jgi:DNA primase